MDREMSNYGLSNMVLCSERTAKIHALIFTLVSHLSVIVTPSMTRQRTNRIITSSNIHGGQRAQATELPKNDYL
jgi:hypothetical protein